MFSIVQKGELAKTTNFLKRSAKLDFSDLDKFGRRGVEALKNATPVDTGLTAKSWYYKIVRDESSVSIQWLNSNVQNGVPIAVILQYGHGTGTGGYVRGVDYINPSLRPIFDGIVSDIWKEVRIG